METEQKQNLKKEFITTWSVRDELLKDEPYELAEIDKVVVPDDIPFLDLYIFTGQRTKVTIEVL